MTCFLLGKFQVSKVWECHGPKWPVVNCEVSSRLFCSQELFFFSSLAVMQLLIYRDIFEVFAPLKCTSDFEINFFESIGRYFFAEKVD